MENCNFNILNDIVERKNLTIIRPVYTGNELEDEFHIQEANKKSNMASFIKYLDPRKLLNFFTILNILTEYDLKNDLIPDIMSGLTVGIVHIPQSLAYGALTSLAPVHGFYTSFYCGLTYVFFGTSKHLSVGTYALVCLMIYSSINRIESQHSNCNHINDLTNQSFNNSFDLNECKMSFRVQMATSLAFWCGIFQIIFALFKFGSVYKYLSQPMLRGFTTAAACFVFTTQIQHVFGIYEPPKPNLILFKLLHPYVHLYKNYFIVNWTAVAISIFSITFLLVTKILINDKFKKQLRNIAIPAELLVIIVGTTVSYAFDLNKNNHLAIVGKVPTGLIKPSLPNVFLFSIVFKDALIIGIVAFASSISVADLYARKHKYKINSNQELFAFGICNLVGSFFRCFISSGSLARSAVFENSGGRTQLVTLIASGVIALVLLCVAPLLEALPKACLGAIIISALINLFKQFNDIKYYWELDKIDFMIWVITFMSSILLDIDYGLVFGILSILIMNTYKFQK